MTIDEARANILREVLYRPPGEPAAEPERGVITAVGRLWVFVHYGDSPQSQATDPADLTLAAGKSAARKDHGDG